MTEPAGQRIKCRSRPVLLAAPTAAGALVIHISYLDFASSPARHSDRIVKPLTAGYNTPYKIGPINPKEHTIMSRPWQVSMAAILCFFTIGAVGWADNPDPFAVPDGGPDKQLEFLQKLEQQRPHDQENIAKWHQAALKSADKILAGNPNAQQLQVAVQVKSSLSSDPTELADLEQTLRKQGHDDLARAVHPRVLSLRLQEAANDPAAFRKQLEAVKEYLAKGPIGPGDAELAQAAGQIAEHIGDDKLAVETYESLAKILAATPQTADLAKSFEGIIRRLKLMGNAMQLEGVQLDGKALDWAKYRGKVVLVDFWATWCGPCMAEIPNIKANYEKYHKQGFDVVGISLDDMDREQLAAAVTKEGVPWTICRDADASTHMAEYYGVQGIPTLILVGRDGKVVSLNARGQDLGPLVEKALAAAGGPAPDAGAVADDSDTKAKTSDKAADAKADKEKAKAAAIAAERAKREEAAKAHAAKPRQWTDTTGNFHVTATFRGMARQVVKLELEDGSVISVPLEKLSDDDQEYIRSRSRQ